MTSHFKRKFTEKKPDISEDQGGLTICNIDWKKSRDLCQFCKMYYNCTREQKQICFSRATDTLCPNFRPIHPAKGGCTYSPEYLAEQIRRKSQSELEKTTGLLY